MKYLVLIILLLFTLNLFSQVGGISIDSCEVILPVLYTFIGDAQKNGNYNAGAIISKHLKGIKVVSPTQMRNLTKDSITPLGIVKYEVHRDIFNYIYLLPTIYIQQKVLQSPEGLKWVLYHELGHFIGLSHVDDDGVMQKAITLGVNLNKEYIIEYFQHIKNLPNKSYWTTEDNTYIE